MNTKEIELQAQTCNQDILNRIGKKFRDKRESLNLSQRDLSKLSTTSIGTISELEQRMNLPKLETVLKIGYALGLDVKDIFSDIVTAENINDIFTNISTSKEIHDAKMRVCEELVKNDCGNKISDLKEIDMDRLLEVALMKYNLKENVIKEIISFVDFKCQDAENLTMSAYKKLQLRKYK